LKIFGKFLRIFQKTFSGKFLFIHQRIHWKTFSGKFLRIFQKFSKNSPENFPENFLKIKNHF
jgi:hypothetical protein